MGSLLPVVNILDMYSVSDIEGAGLQFSWYNQVAVDDCTSRSVNWIMVAPRSPIGMLCSTLSMPCAHRPKSVQRHLNRTAGPWC